MTYDDLMEKVLAGKSVNARAKEIGIPQVTLNNYKRGSRIPSCAMTIKLAEIAGIPIEEAVKAVAEKEMEARPLQTSSFLRPAMASVLTALSFVLVAAIGMLPAPNASASSHEYGGSKTSLSASIEKEKARCCGLFLFRRASTI